MEFINPYSLPAIAALILKLLLLWIAKVMPLRNSESKIFLAFLSVLALHNFSEVMVFNYSGPQEGVIPLRSGLLYFSMSIAAMAVLLHLMLVRLRASTGWEVPVERWRWAVYAPAGGVLTMLWMTDDMIRGFVSYGFSYTRVPGPLYVWFEAYALGYLLASIALLVVAALYSINRNQRKKNLLTLLGMAPIITMPMVVIILQNFHLSVFNLPLWFALALTFFLMVMAYAIYEHRLFDIFFHLPGTRLYQRRTSFHQRIRSFTAELDRLPTISIQEALNKLAATLKCSVALVGADRKTLEAEPLSTAPGRMKIETLRDTGLDRIDDIVLTKELRIRDPENYATLSEANCAAVIPFRPFRETSAGWLLLGGRRNAPDELPIDFAMVESLFDRMGDLFLENLVKEREKLGVLHKEIERLQTTNEDLKAELARKEQAMEMLYGDYEPQCTGAGPEVPLDQLTAGLEKKVISQTLAQLKGNVSATAKTLGLTRQTLYARMESYGIESDKWRKGRRRRRS